MPKKYCIISDLHLEFRQGKEDAFWEVFPKDKEIKTCICAGDLTSFGLPDAIVYKHFLGLCVRFDKVIYVPGNHEYYGTNPTNVSQRLIELESCFSPTLKVMRTGESYTFDDQRFIGDTMWFPDKPEVHIYKRQINDSFQIKDLFPWAFTESSLFMTYIKKELKEDDIVISHHVPNNVDTDARWRGATTQSYFVNDTCDRYCTAPNSILPKAWIYGHTHDKHHYKIGDTQFICNPIGYPNENGDLAKVLESITYEI